MAPLTQFALITGATSGIGYELAKLFAKDKYNLVIVARTQADLDKTAQELQQNFNIEVITIAKDLFKREAAFEIYEEIQSRGITINVLVNDAGQGQYGEFTETDINRELDIIQLNISSLVVLTKLYLKDMVARNEGKILNVASIASKLPGPLQAVYHATKAFVLSFSEAIRAENKETGVTITALMPGATATDFFHKANMEDAKMIQEGKLDDPVKVAMDGYNALIAGKDKVISGMHNKVQVAMSNITPDSKVADNMLEQMKPVSEDNKH